MTAPSPQLRGLPRHRFAEQVSRFGVLAFFGPPNPTDIPSTSPKPSIDGGGAVAGLLNLPVTWGPAAVGPSFPLVALVSPNTASTSRCTGARQGVLHGLNSGLGRCASSIDHIVNCVSASSMPSIPRVPQQLSTGQTADGETAASKTEIEDGRDSVH